MGDLTSGSTFLKMAGYVVSVPAATIGTIGGGIIGIGMDVTGLMSTELTTEEYVTDYFSAEPGAASALDEISAEIRVARAFDASPATKNAAAYVDPSVAA